MVTTRHSSVAGEAAGDPVTAAGDPVLDPAAPSNIEDVPDVSAEWYLDIADFAHSTPSWLREFTAFCTEAVIVLLGVILLWTWWRARKHTARSMALALLAPVGVVIAYLVSEHSKTFLQAPRPCRTFPRVDAIAECPLPGDWSFPSNHATVAGAIALGALLAWPRMGLFTVPLAALAGYSRVFVGVHYPHDVVTGLLLGPLVATIVILSPVRPGTTLVGRLRRHRNLGVLLAAESTTRAGRTEPAADGSAGAGPSATIGRGHRGACGGRER